MKAFQLKFETRMQLQVATAVAEEVENGTRHGVPFGGSTYSKIRPILLSINKNKFRFEGGTVVEVFTHWDEKDGDIRVDSCLVRFYELDKSCFRKDPIRKAHLIISKQELRQLKATRPWWHPHVAEED